MKEMLENVEQKLLDNAQCLCNFSRALFTDDIRTYAQR